MSTLIVLAKAPVPGRVKTRLTPAFTPQQAADLAEAALADTLDAVLAAPADHRLLVLDGAPGSWLPGGFRVVPQVAGTLDVRLAAAYAAAAKRDSGPALLVGMDTPQVPSFLLADGLAHLTSDSADAVFGPAEDGGFWCLGLREPGHERTPDLLLGVPMSRSDTGWIQRTRLDAAGLVVKELPSMRDIDTAPDAYAAARMIPRSRFAWMLAAHSKHAAAARRTPAGDTATGSVTVTPAPRGGDRSLRVRTLDGGSLADEDHCPGEPCPGEEDPQWHGPVGSSYERALWQSLSGSADPVVLRGDDGCAIELDVAKYAYAADATDAALLDRCTGPTLDIGCGPGRLVAELARRGVPSLGVDVTPVALLLARAAGAMTLRRSVFDRLPGEGRWPHALLIDGNIGIGGDPSALLARVKTLLRPGVGELLVETEADEIDERHSLRLDAGGPPVAWARVGIKALCAAAEPLGYRVADTWESEGRHFAALAV